MKEIMKARKRDAPVKPPAQLEPHPGDLFVPPMLFLVCGMFARLRSKPSPEKFPGTLVLRCYRKGEVICRQNEPGWTAFAILSAADLQALHAERARLLDELPGKLQLAVQDDRQEDARKLREHIAALHRADLPPRPDSPLPPQGDPATVYLDSSRQQARKQGLLRRLFSSPKRSPRKQRFIPVDPATALEHGTRQATLPEGKIFGQWSCIYGTPRSATIVAERDCYVLEMLRNVLDSILGDRHFQEETDREYVSGTLDNYLPGLEIFSELTAEQLAEVRQVVELVRYGDGQIIFDRGDPPDCMYLVRRGVVKVLLNDWPLLASADVLDWPALASAIGKQERDTPPLVHIGRKLDQFNAVARDRLLRSIEAPEGRPTALWAINSLLKDRHLRDVESAKTKKPEVAEELKPLLASPAFKEALASDFPDKELDWSDQDWRRYNRLLLESACPGLLRTVRLPRKESGSDRPAQSRSENILAYLSQGDFFGEMGVMLNEPRNATCVAYVHPRPEADEVDPVGDRWRREEARIELVKIPKELFHKLCDRYPSFKARVDVVIRQRQARTRHYQSSPSWEDSGPVHHSDRFQSLGLIQGQKLMLIDLDRCTRCDECVKACVSTHEDGRSRLFLDGPRFGRYLIPTTCRSCRDPVCMIGCPVGSIRRGDNLEIVIEDWCIGCQLCAKNCPYGSIQMHDLGILPEESHGWAYLPAARVSGDGWTKPAFKDRHWLEGTSPFWSDVDLEATLDLALKGAPATPDRSRAICFRKEFTLDGEILARAESAFKVVIEAAAEEVVVEGTGRQAKLTRFLPVWLNGEPVPLECWKPDRNKPEAPARGLACVFEISGDDRKRFLRAGRNVLAVQATPLAGKRDPAGARLLQTAIDEIRTSGAVIPLRAVVCDQCSTLPDQVQACVHACPHDAAMRRDAWTDFPVR
jgi:Fe-S-cluster-containing hydrogenase component 2